MDLRPTKLAYFDDMQKLQSTATILSYFQAEDGRHALLLDSTIFHPQGGGQPSDTGFVSNPDADFKFVVQDVRLKDGVVFHYGLFDYSQEVCTSKIENEQEICLFVDGQRRNLNSRLHTAGHLLDICLRNVGLAYLEPGKGYHFPDGPFVEYKGTIPPNELQNKQKELEIAANELISNGGKVSAAVLPYEEAYEMCGGSLPTYISKVSQIRVKKGLTKVFYSIEP
ncbi:uncharacterized protein LOC131225282 isoform X2 [Magnolia sinica]|uniref:uncharacterized protein LOC131225282 isoform X2 n=1 Tax=Magnolia sinica TaxID=86752 RepID=UPI002658A6F9|nr:uncharacterized protein LOC131225282 isoform X2 [Magnolia sinica]